MNELILVVDDEPKIVRLARDYLEQSSFRVLPVYDGPSALAAARQEKPDLIVLDLNLPGMDGIDVARSLRRESSVPIIMLTARAEEMDRLIGLEVGADDYIVKPFSPRELVARVRAVLRRTQGEVQTPGLLRTGALEIDLNGHRVTRQNQSQDQNQGQSQDEVIKLTRIEFTLLATLAQHPGQTFSRAQLIQRLHGSDDAGFDRSIDAHIKNLRRKLEDDPADPRYIQTVYGIGYKFAETGQFGEKQNG
ncbi:MAG: response regulator transcription factor [Caldilineaceae bacterium]|nr:response regulator transcription factor [Caldilineaceae bacterium]